MEVNSINLDRLCVLHDIKLREELLTAIGTGEIVLGTNDITALKIKNKNGISWKKYIPFISLMTRDNNNTADSPKEEAEEKEDLKIDKKKPLILNEGNIKRFMIANCCHPIPGDDVLGYWDDKNRITIHKRQCPVAAKLKTSDGNHILAAVWDTHKKLFFPATIQFSGIDHAGVLNQITNVLSQQLNVNIKRLNIESKDGIFEGKMELSVHDAEDLKIICKNLKDIPELKEVMRIS